MSYIGIQQSLTDLRSAFAGILRDAWHTERRQLLMLVALAGLMGLMPYVSNGVLALLINELIAASSTHAWTGMLVTLLVVLGAVMLIRDALNDFSAHFERIAWIDRRQRYEIGFTQKLASLDVATHEDRAFKDEVQVLHEEGVSYTLADYVSKIIDNAQNVVGLVSASLIVLAIDWRYFIATCIAVSPQLYIELRYGRGIWSIHQSQSTDRRLYTELSSHTTRAESIRELQSLQAVNHFVGRQRELLSKFLNAQKGEERWKFLLMLLSQLLLSTVMITILCLLVRDVVAGSMQVGTLTFAFATIAGLEGTLTAFLVNAASFRTKARPVAAYFAILGREPVVKKPANGFRMPGGKTPRIEFRDIAFAYPTTPERPILDGFSLAIEPGERLAIVGANSAGKTTLMKLLQRFYDPTRGSILIDGIDMRTVDLDDWYGHLAILPQEFNVFDLTIEENIKLGRITSESGKDVITHAAERAEISEYIASLPGQYGQQLGNEFGGVELSGGMRQKLALARTLYRHASVTILDEPTAHVDADAEQRIFERLERELGRDQTLILISHRFSTVRNADRICVIDEGRVAELGSHDELMTLNGTYARLFTQQAKAYR